MNTKLVFYFLAQFLCQAIENPENHEGTQVIVGSMNMGYISDTARNRTHNLFRPKREPIPLGHSDSEFRFGRWQHENNNYRDFTKIILYIHLFQINLILFICQYYLKY